MGLTSETRCSSSFNDQPVILNTGKDRPSDVVFGNFYNLFDQDPPFARYGLSYDPYLGSPLGRNFRVTVTKRIW